MRVNNFLNFIPIRFAAKEIIIITGKVPSPNKAMYIIPPETEPEDAAPAMAR